MGNSKITIKNIQTTFEKLNLVDGNTDEILIALHNAQTELDKALISANNLTVKGKESMDILLGCILAIEQIMGIEGV